MRQAAAAVNLSYGLSYGPSYGLSYGPSYGLSYGPSYGIIRASEGENTP